MINRTQYRYQNSAPDVSSYLGEYRTYLHSAGHSSITHRQKSLFTIIKICLMAHPLNIPFQNSGLASGHSPGHSVIADRCICFQLLPTDVSAYLEEYLHDGLDQLPFHWTQYQNSQTGVSAYLEEYLYDGAGHSTGNISHLL
jgi:hypothetical protein